MTLFPLTVILFITACTPKSQDTDPAFKNINHHTESLQQPAATDNPVNPETSALQSESSDEKTLAAFYNTNAIGEETGNPCNRPPGLLANVRREDFQQNPDPQIATCAVIERVKDACPLSTLDFLGNTAEPLTRDLILSRTLVSDPWMRENFSLFLDNLPDTALPLFSSVTAVIIHRHIKPAFFLGVTGAIYIDPHYLWQTEEQKATLGQTRDFRDCLAQAENQAGSESHPDHESNRLQFIPMTRYVQNRQYALANPDGSRSLFHMKMALASVVFHELAHAADRFPRDRIQGIDKTFSPLEVSNHLQTDKTGQVSGLLAIGSPLINTTLRTLANVLYNRGKPTKPILSLEAADLGAQFENSRANDLYSFSKTSEDVAMLFEEFMMKRLFELDREVAFAKLTGETLQTCDDLEIQYKTGNRIFAVKERAHQVVAAILPDYFMTEIEGKDLEDWRAESTWCECPSPCPLTSAQPGEDPPALPLFPESFNGINVSERQFHGNIHAFGNH